MKRFSTFFLGIAVAWFAIALMEIFTTGDNAAANAAFAAMTGCLVLATQFRMWGG